MATKVKDDRKWVSREYGTVSTYSSLSSVIEELKTALQAEERGEWKDLILDLAQYPYGDGYYISIEGKRLENDKELAERLTQEAEWAKKAEEREKSEYERLRKKYDKP